MGPSRRTVLRSIGTSAIAAAAGCTGRTQSPDADVLVGPESRLVFEPEELTVEVGDTVSWYFESPGHNVSGRPEDSELVKLPEGARHFSSYDAENSSMSVEPRGETYEHRFDRPGEYQYVCVPHIAAGMIGKVIAEE